MEKKEKKKKNFMVGNEKDVVVNMTHRAEGQFQPLFFLYLIRQGREKKEGEKLGKRTERGKKHSFARRHGCQHKWTCQAVGQ